ncbi:MAG: tryptophan 7-halogenase [Magnetovibrio sp.]|nr:tryptophan 7-halogenase [Magnetovibrio sp.]
MSDTFDIAIIGSGIAGASLAAILARHGKRVLVLEAKTHPRFAIGESMILETSETLRALATLYDVPELAYYSSENFLPIVGNSHGIKRHFSFLHHSENEPLNFNRSFQAVIPKQPHGHELHVYRQDSDYFLTSIAISYGATVKQNTPVNDITITDKCVTIKTDHKAFKADFIVDSGGYKSIIAEKFKLRDYDLQTHSRGIFTHMIDVPSFHDGAASEKEFGFPYPLTEGTLHHVFDGGWLWVIPFNNHKKSTNPLCSVGLMLDPRKHPENKNLSPRDEFFSFIKRFPDIERQFCGTKSVRQWTRSGRIQYSSTKLIGKRFALLGHAAGFVDPLFSKGMYASLSCVGQLATPLLDNNKDYPVENFKVYEERTKAFIKSHDRLVANSYKSFQNHKLWSVYLILWLLGAYMEFVKLMNCRIESKTYTEYTAKTKDLHLVGGNFIEFDHLAEKIDEIITEVDPLNGPDVNKAVANIKALFAATDWLPDAFVQALKGKNHLPKNKIRWSLLHKKSGFMHHGDYRKHFFGDHKKITLIKTFMNEKQKYSETTLTNGYRHSLNIKGRF